MDISRNTIPLADASYSGLYYAYEASGGFVMEQGIASTTIDPSNNINRYDVTNSLQVEYDVNEFNAKLGMYNEDNNGFPADHVTLTAADFLNNVLPEHIISVGKYSTLYSDFNQLLNAYFGYPQGFTSLFTATIGTISNPIFDASAMVNLMHASSTVGPSGEYIKDISGSITISYINGFLQYACDNNPFNNRDSASGKTIQDGFVENDLVYVPTGTTVTLIANIINTDTANNYIIPTTSGDAHIRSSRLNPTDYSNPVQIQTPTTVIVPGDETDDYVNGTYSQTTTFTAGSIKRVITVPMLIVLKNLSP